MHHCLACVWFLDGINVYQTEFIGFLRRLVEWYDSFFVLRLCLFSFSCFHNNLRFVLLLWRNSNHVMFFWSWANITNVYSNMVTDYNRQYITFAINNEYSHLMCLQWRKHAQKRFYWVWIDHMNLMCAIIFYSFCLCQHQLCHCNFTIFTRFAPCHQTTAITSALQARRNTRWMIVSFVIRTKGPHHSVRRLNHALGLNASH